jgi:tetratricopeptide (TPR) repeat protein
MDLHPWDLWVNGAPRPWTPEIVGTLEQALKLNPKHPGANHYYIHAVEASPSPGRAVIAADRLVNLVPDSGHMVHMPSHIYARVGRWPDAAERNREAIRVDATYRAIYPRPGFYAMYMMHNLTFPHLLCNDVGTTGGGDSHGARDGGKRPARFSEHYTAVADGFMVLVPEALMRFGRWQEILDEPEPRADLYLARALWRFTRASALTALGRTEQAKAEQAAFEQAVAQVPKDRTMGNNSVTNILTIAAEILAGEMAAQAGDYDQAIQRLRNAVKVEDQLVYDEPPGWIQPTRHTLGAVLLKAGKATEAEVTYREELTRNPENGWSLMGLRDSLQRQGKKDEAEAINRRYKKAWAYADVTPPSTCYCQKLD